MLPCLVFAQHLRGSLGPIPTPPMRSRGASFFFHSSTLGAEYPNLFSNLWLQRFINSIAIWCVKGLLTLVSLGCNDRCLEGID